MYEFIRSSRLALCLMGLGSIAACGAAAPQPAPVPAPGTPSNIVPEKLPEAPKTPPVEIPPLPQETPGQARVDASALTAQARAEVQGFIHYTPAVQKRFIALAHTQLDAAHITIDRAQIIMVVDRNPGVQELCYVLAFADDTPWIALGGTHVSTGRTGRKYYYITPTGVFPNSIDRLGYRAEGTKNEHGIRGIGVKGMRVWDMGWHNAQKGWIPRGEYGDIRLEIHATDPKFLAWRLGHPDSEGCIRIPATLNTFMDRHGLIDALYEQAATYDPRFKALLRKDRTPTPIAGDLVVVVDSGPPALPEIDPLAAKRPLP